MTLATHFKTVAAALFVAAVGVGTVPSSFAQDGVADPVEARATDPPAHVSVVDGSAVLERDGQPETAPLNMPLLAGDRLRTQGGRVEILFADGSTLHLDTNTTVDFQSDELVRLLDGRVRLAIPGPDRAVNYRIDAPSASALIQRPGEYRLSVLHGPREEVELAVLRGEAELVNDDGRTPLRAGERAYARAEAAPSYAYVFNSASWDAFDRWSEARRDRRLGVSAQYLPGEVRPYAPALDQYGGWQYDAAYGYVWYPRVAAGWRPYYNGRWMTMRSYGWTWVGVDPWAWPTHHYGRWGISAGAWFWIPGRSWAPAWVSWASAPGYISWCPLGWNNRPVLQIVYGGRYDPWRAWTAVPRRHFGGDYVNVHYVAGSRFDARTRGAFVPRYAPPESRGYAVPRSSTPIRGAGTIRPRDSNSTVYTNLEPGASRVGQGGRRVMVGPPRNSVNERPADSVDDRSVDRPAAVRRGLPVDRDASESSRNAFGVPGTRDREPGGRAVPRAEPTYRPGLPPAASGMDRGAVVAPEPDAGAPAREYPYGRRGPGVAAPRSGEDRNGGDGVRQDPYGNRSFGAARPVGPDPAYRPRGDAPRPAPESMSAPPPRPSGGGIERRGPGMDRPSGPPPDSARPGPGPGGVRGNPGVERGGPPSGGGPPPQARPRPGGQSSGTATRRGGGG